MATYPWDTRRDIRDRAMVDDLRLPRAYGDTSGDPLGMVDPLALTALSQGGAYDIQARRALIAKRLLDNEMAQRGTAVAAVAPTASAASVSDVSRGYFPGGDVSQGVGAGDAASAGAMSAGQGSQSFGDMIGGGRSGDFMSGAPPGNSMFGTGDRSSLADPNGGAMTTSNAAMITDTTNTDRQSLPEGAPPGWGFAGAPGDPNAPAAFGGRGGPGREGFGIVEVGDIAEHAPAQAPDLAENAPGGKGDKAAVTDEGDVLAEGATSTVGDRTALGLPSGSPGLPSMVGWDTGRNISDLFDMGKTAMSRGWDAVTAPVMTPSDVPDAPDRAPVATSTPQPGGRAPMSFATPNEGDTIASPGAGPGPGGFGGFSEGAVGGYAGGPGSTEGFGAGFSGSASMGNTQGAQGFTTGMTDPGSGGFTGGGTAGDTAGAGDTSGGGSSSSSGDTAGGSPGGVG